MLSTSHTLLCPTCGQPATVRVHTQRSFLRTHRQTFEPMLSFACRRGCRIEPSELAQLCVIENLEIAARPA